MQFPDPMITQATSCMDVSSSSTIKLPPRLSHMDKKGSGRFQFKKTQLEEQQSQIQNNRDRIKQQLRGQMNLIINKPIVNQQNSQIKEQLKELGDKLDIEITEYYVDYIIPNTKDFENQYEICESLGEGCLGLVKRVVEKETGLQYAIKIVATQDDEIVRNMIVEFKSLLKVNHDNIVKVYKLYLDFNNGFQSESKAYVLMELIEGKEMFEVINDLGHYGDEDAKELFKQLLNAVEYMHRHGICHRDLKPHNILCMKDKKQIKVTDFNVSKFSESYKEFGDLKDLEKIEMWTYTGTVAFSAPEIFTGEGYNQMVDMWSAGCILYTMLSGQLPFNADYLHDLIDKIKNAQYDFPAELFDGVSSEAIDLIKQLLQQESEHRPHADQALLHNWFSEDIPIKRRTSLRKMTFNQNISHLSSRYSDKTKQRTILLGSQNFICHNLSELETNKNDDQQQPSIFNFDVDVQLSLGGGDDLQKKYDTNRKSIFASHKSASKDLSESLYEQSPLDKISPDSGQEQTIQCDLQKFIVFDKQTNSQQMNAQEQFNKS